MSLRSKTKRRLLILIGLFVLVGVGLFWVVRGPRVRDAARAAELRRVGMELYARGDHAAAMPKLSDYLALVKIAQKEPTDAELEALYAFGDCRRRIPLPKREHLREASDRVQLYLEHRPADLRALRTQAELLNRLDRAADAAAAADRVLAQDPLDRDALYYRARGLYRQPKPDLPAVEKALGKLLAQDPGHVRGLLLAQQVRIDAGTAPADLIADAEKLAAGRPNDPRFEVVVARVYQSVAAGPTGRQDPAQRVAWEKQARAWAQKAAARPPADVDTAEQVVEALDRASLFADAVTYLKLATGALAEGDADLERALVRRLWQNAAYVEVLDRTAKLAAGDAKVDPDLLAYRAMSLQFQAAQPSAGDARTRLLNDAYFVTEALAARTTDATAQGWAAVLRAGADASPTSRPSTGQLITLYRQAREKDPDNAVAVVALADAYSNQGEVDPAAIQLWDLGSRMRPDWGYPHWRIGQVRLDQGRTDEADARASRAWQRWPSNRQFIALLVRARYANLGPSPAPAALEALLADVERVQQGFPNDPGTLPMHVTLLAKVRGAGPAAARLAAALDAKPALPAPTLLQLQAVDAAHNLGKAAAVAAALGKYEGTDPDLAGRRAAELLAQGKGAEGLKFLEDARKRAKGEADPRWMLAVADLRDRMNDPDAAKAWAALGEQAAKSLHFQTQILRSTARFRDRDLWAKTIDRARALTGDDGPLWKTERARWLLADPNVGTKERAEAISLLTELTQRPGDTLEAHVLLGLALAREGKRERAAEALTVAFARAPSRADVGLELVATLRAIGKANDAMGRLKEVAALPSLTADQKVRAAGHLEDLGLPEQAVGLLASVPAGGERDARLGRLYRATNRPAEAAAAYKRVLNDPAARPGDVFAGADFFAAAGDAAATRLFLDRLQTMPQSDALTQMALGQFEAVYGSPDTARQRLTRATELAPKDPLAWRVLTGFLMRARKYDDAVKAVDAGLAAVGGGDAELSALKPLVATVRTLVDVEPVRPLVEYLTQDPTNPAAAEMLQVLAEGQAAAAAPSADRAAVATQTRERLAKLADKHPGFWQLQEEVIKYLLATNRPERAAELAERAIPAFPTLPYPPEYAAAAHSVTGRWDKVIEAATVWRDRTPGDPVPADIAMAGALIGKQQRLAAVQVLEPHVRANPLPSAPPTTGRSPTTGGSATSPATRPALKPYTLSLYRTYGRALIGAARPTEAAERLQPLLALGTEGRLTWLGLAAAHAREEQARQWIEPAAAIIGPTAPPRERLALAEAWLQAGRAAGSDALMKRAAEVLQPLVAGPSPAPEALARAAYVAHFRGDYAAAERYWRSVRPLSSSPDVLNNLAYALLLGGRDAAVPEARKLADEAVAAEPDNAGFLGTQARAMARQGQRDGAISTYRVALAKDARNVEAMVGLAEELAKGSAPEKEEAVTLLTRAGRAIDEDPQPVAPEVKKQLEAVRTTIGAAAGN